MRAMLLTSAKQVEVLALSEEWTLKYLDTLASEKKHRQTTRQHKYLPITAFIHRNLSTALAYCYYL